MNWHRISEYLSVSECQQYELYGAHFNGSFAWRGRVIETDHLVQSSADREFVKLCCDRHQRAAHAEASA